MKMDDVPDEIEVKGVKGKRFKSYRRYIGKDNIPSGWALVVSYLFDLKALHEVDAAKYYDVPSKVQSSEGKANATE